MNQDFKCFVGSHKYKVYKEVYIIFIFILTIIIFMDELAY